MLGQSISAVDVFVLFPFPNFVNNDNYFNSIVSRSLERAANQLTLSEGKYLFLSSENLLTNLFQLPGMQNAVIIIFVDLPIDMDYHAFSSLSTVDLKEILHKRQIDSTGIYDREALIQLAMGKTQHVNHEIQIPQSYIELFEVLTWMHLRLSVGWKSAKGRCRREDTRVFEESAASHNIQSQFSTVVAVFTLLFHRQQDDRTVMTVVENMPAKYKEDEIRMIMEFINHL